MADELEQGAAEGLESQLQEGMDESIFPGGDAGEGGGGEGGEGGAGEGAQPPKPQVVNLSPETIAQMMAAFPAKAQPDGTPQERQLTQEEIDQALQIFKPDAALLRELGLQDTALPAFSRAMQAVVKQAVAMSYLATQKARMDLMKDITPVREYVTQAREREMRTQFFEKYPDLKPYEKLVEAVYAKMGSQNMRFATVEEGFKAINDQAVAMLKTFNITPGQAGGQGGGTAPNAPRRMPTLSSGGRGGAAPASVDGSKVAKTMFS